MKNSNPRQRKDYFIKKWFQFKFSFIFIIIIIIGNTIFGTYMYNKMSKHLTYYLYTSHTQLSNTWDILKDIIIESSLVTFSVFFVIFLLIIYVLTKKLSKGFDSISKDINRLNSGDFEGDCVVKCSKSFDKLKCNYTEARCYLKENINDIKSNISDIGTALDKLENFTMDKDKRSIIMTLEDIESYNDKINKNINKINIEVTK